MKRFVKGTVLIIDRHQGHDGEAPVAKKWARELERDGYQVESFDDVEHGMTRALANDLVAIVLDMGMEHMGAPTFTQRLRREGHTVPILWITGKREPDDEQLACRLFGVALHTREEMSRERSCVRLVSQVVEQSQMQRELQSLMIKTSQMAESIESLNSRIFTKEQIIDAVREVMTDAVIEKVGPDLKDKAKVAVSESWWFRSMACAVATIMLAFASMQSDISAIKDKVAQLQAPAYSPTPAPAPMASVRPSPASTNTP